MPARRSVFPDTSRRDWTVEELELLPDDGNRYELVDGALLVTPAPLLLHQRASRELVRLLLPALDGTGLELLYAPTAVRVGPRSQVEPDILVVPTMRDASARYVTGLHSLRLAVEIISPSSAHSDRNIKRVAYLAQGVPEYWIVDAVDRLIERWRAGEESAEVLQDSLAWRPIESGEPLVIDLPAYFRRVHGE